MPGDSFKLVSSGEPFQPSAAAWNSFLDTTKEFKAKKFGQGAKGPDLARPTSVAPRVHNASGSDVERGAVLGIDGPLWTPDEAPDTFADEPLLKGVTPTEEHKGSFVITTGPIKDGTIGRGILVGAVWTHVNFQAADDGFAEAVPDELHLQSGSSGSAKVLYKEAGTGLKWAIVLLGSAATEFRCMRGQLVGDMTSSDSTWPIDHIVMLAGEDPRDDPESETEQVPCSNALLGGAGIDGADFLAIWDKANEEWMFLQGHHVALDVITSRRVDGANMKLQYKTTSIAVMVNGEESDWIDEHTGREDCPEP